MPKRRKVVADWGPETPAGLPHSSKLVRGARNHPRAKRGSLEGKGKSPDEEKDCPATEGRQANPKKKYLVGGSLVNGDVFPEGQLPANARPASPAPWRHIVRPRPGKER